MNEERKPYQLYLTKKEKENLEKMRARQGLRSWAEVIRKYINND